MSCCCAPGVPTKKFKNKCILKRMTDSQTSQLPANESSASGEVIKQVKRNLHRYFWNTIYQILQTNI